MNLYDVTSTSPANESFVKNFKAKDNEDPGYQAAYGYDNIFFLKKAIEGNGGSARQPFGHDPRNELRRRDRPHRVGRQRRRRPTGSSGVILTADRGEVRVLR